MHNIIIAGVGGQGNVLAAQLIGNAALEEGFHVNIGEVYGAAQRGGPVMSHIRFSREKKPSFLVPEGNANVILGLEPVETLRVGAKYLNTETTVIINPRPVHSIDVISGAADYPPIEQVIKTLKELTKKLMIVDAYELAIRAGDSLAMNVVMIGAIAGSGLIPIKKDAFLDAIKTRIPERVLELNLKAFEFGFDAMQEILRE